MLRTIHIVILLLVANLASAGLLWFGYVNMSENKAKETELRAELGAENQKGAQLAKLEATLASAEKDRENLEKYLFDPNEKNQIALISEMEQLGPPTTGASVTTTSLDVTQSKTPVVHGEFKITGQWSQMYHVLRLIETYPSHLVISRFSMSRSSSGGSFDPWSGTLSADIISLKPKQ